MESNKHTELVQKIIAFVLMFLPILAYIITQFALLFFNFASIVVLLIMILILRMNFSFKPHTSTTENTTETPKEYPDSNGQTPNRQQISNIDIELKSSRPISAKVVCLIMAALMIGASILTYSLSIKKVKSSNAILVDAEVVEVIDKSTRTREYDGDHTVEKINNRCFVKFSYTIDDETMELEHEFWGISSFKAKNIQIYVSNGKFVSTAYALKWGWVFVVYFILLAVFNIVKAVYASEALSSALGTIFASTAVIFISALEVSFKQVFFVEFGAIIMILTTVGIGMILFGKSAKEYQIQAAKRQIKNMSYMDKER